MALIPSFFADCVVAVGLPPDDESGPTWIGSAFFYGHPVGVDDEDGKTQYRVYLISNKHVFDEPRHILIRANPQSDAAEGVARDFRLDLQTEVDGAWTPLWLGHPDADVDVAAAPVGFDVLIDEGMQASFFAGDEHSLTRAELVDEGVTEGDFVYVLGYPMGLVGDHRSVVIVRNGSIARVRDALGLTEKTFLVDATVFPGNSGGPVVLKPELVSITGTTAQNKARLIGVVRGYVPYRDVAVSAQTQLPRVIFEENSGLVAVHLVDAIKECVETDPTLHQQQIDGTGVATPPPGEAESQEAQVSTST